MCIFFFPSLPGHFSFGRGGSLGIVLRGSDAHGSLPFWRLSTFYIAISAASFKQSRASLGGSVFVFCIQRTCFRCYPWMSRFPAVIALLQWHRYLILGQNDSWRPLKPHSVTSIDLCFQPHKDLPLRSNTHSFVTTEGSSNNNVDTTTNTYS